MKAVPLRIKVMGPKAAGRDFARVVERKRAEAEAGKHVEPERDLVFGSYEDLRTFLTTERMRLLRLIRREKPASIYALAKLAQRDRGAVTADLDTLVMLGLVRLTRTKGPGRAHTVPHVDYDRIEFGVDV